MIILLIRILCMYLYRQSRSYTIFLIEASAVLFDSPPKFLLLYALSPDEVEEVTPPLPKTSVLGITLYPCIIFPIFWFLCPLEYACWSLETFRGTNNVVSVVAHEPEYQTIVSSWDSKLREYGWDTRPRRRSNNCIICTSLSSFVSNTSY